MTGLAPAIHVFFIKQDGDTRHKAGRNALREWLSPLHVMAGKDLAHLGDEIDLVDLDLRLGLAFRYSSRSLISVSPAPDIKSLICTLPLAFSSEPCTIAQGELRRSAYFICWPRLCLGLPR